MIFGPVPAREAAGAILAHGLALGGRSFKKGRLLSDADTAHLVASGLGEVVVARLEPGDVAEDAAAERLARLAAGSHVACGAAGTGRVNLFAETSGLLVVDEVRLDALNAIDEALTLASLAPFAAVEPRRMVATAKVIPFAVPGESLARAEALAQSGGPILRVAPFRPLAAALLQTTLPSLKPSVLDKTERVTEARLAALGCRLTLRRHVPHEAAALAEAILAARAAGAGLVLVIGASAIVDRRDVIPDAVERAGGRVEHFGMPVDPGNLLLLAALGDGPARLPVLGLPGCARSPAMNGMDWVMQRLVAGLEVTRRDIMRMGAGGLLAEMPTRPHPRAPETRPAPRLGVLVLAAGLSRRMGARNKLLAEVGGVAMVRRAAEAALGAGGRPVVVVVGHEAASVRAVLAGLPVAFAENPDYAEGLSTSLRAGLAALPPDIDGAFVALGDMPHVTADTLARIAAGFDPASGRAIVVPTCAGRRGNPILWARRFFAEMAEMTGDRGARPLLEAHAGFVAEVELGEAGVLFDVDTPEALATALAAEARPTQAEG